MGEENLREGMNNYLKKYFVKKYKMNEGAEKLIPDNMLLELFRKEKYISKQDEDEHPLGIIYNGIYKIGERYFSYPMIKPKNTEYDPDELIDVGTLEDINEVYPQEIKKIIYRRNN